MVVRKKKEKQITVLITMHIQQPCKRRQHCLDQNDKLLALRFIKKPTLSLVTNRYVKMCRWNYMLILGTLNRIDFKQVVLTNTYNHRTIKRLQRNPYILSPHFFEPPVISKSQFDF